MFKSITQLVKNSLRRQANERHEADLMIEKIDGQLTDNMRALRLAVTMADHLLSRGMAASDVVHTVLGVTTVYCSRKVHIDISYTILSISQDRGIDREPLTTIRPIASRGADYETIRQLETLGHDIRAGKVVLDDAETRLDKIISRPRLYPRWVSHLAAGGVSAGVVLLYSENPIAWAAAFLIGATVNVALYRLAKAGVPSFYAQAVAGVVITLLAVIVSVLSSSDVIPLPDGVNPTLLIIGGIVLMVAGMMIVSAFQDAIDEYYVTAAARLLKVVMMTSGIVVGVTIGLYAASRLGVAIDTTPDRLSLTSINYRYVGAAVLAASFALGNQLRPFGVIGAGVAGFIALYSSLALSSLGLGVIAASGVAAALVGLLATIMLNLFRTPTLAIMSAGIIPLVPGLTLYSGLMYISQSAPNTADFDTGVMLIMRAILIAVAVAAGVTFGNLIGRPAQRRLIHFQNRLPRRFLSVRKKGTKPTPATGK